MSKSRQRGRVRSNTPSQQQRMQLPVFIPDEGDVVPFPPNVAYGGCTCAVRGTGRHRVILLKTVGDLSAREVKVSKKLVGPSQWTTVRPETEVEIGGRIGTLTTRYMDVTGMSGQS